MAEQLKPNYPETKFSWCRGRDIPVEIHVWGENKPRRGTVTALVPEKNEGTKGLFLDGARLTEPVLNVMILKGGEKKDIADKVKGTFAYPTTRSYRCIIKY